AFAGSFCTPSPVSYISPSCQSAVGCPVSAASSSASTRSSLRTPSRMFAMLRAASTAVSVTSTRSACARAGAAPSTSVAAAKPAAATSDVALNVRITLLLALAPGIGQRAIACRSHELGILPDCARAELVPRRRPVSLPPRDLVIGHIDFDGPGNGVDSDDVTVTDVRDRAAHGRFRTDMADAEATGGAGKAAVGDQGDLVAHALPIEGRRGRQHLAHAGPALRT